MCGGGAVIGEFASLAKTWIWLELKVWEDHVTLLVEEIGRDISINIEVSTTCLISQAANFICGPKCNYISMPCRSWQLIPTKRTHFICWLYHCHDLALGVFDSVKFDSFDFVGVEDSSCLLIPCTLSCMSGPIWVCAALLMSSNFSLVSSAGGASRSISMRISARSVTARQ